MDYKDMQLSLLKDKKRNNLLTIDEAAKWASEYLEKIVTPSNISYLIQYALINRYYDDSGESKVAMTCPQSLYHV
jgi:hypothetical protein